MDLNSNHKSSVLKDPSPSVNQSRLGVSSRFMMSQWKKPAKLDDVRSNGWLDAMISSSPPRKKLVKDFNVEVAPEDDFAQRAWMVIVINAKFDPNMCFLISTNILFGIVKNR
jgi:trehalose 6-phosphate phosphatase